MSTVYLIRHGETVQQNPKRYIGQTDLPLTKKGLAQMQRLGRYLSDKKIARFFCSDLKRSRYCSQLLAEHCCREVESLQEFREIFLGEWEALTREEVIKKFPGEYEKRGNNFAQFRPLKGESFLDLQQRVWPAFQRIAESADGTAVIVAHAGVNRVILATVLKMSLQDIFLLEQDYGCLNIIHYESGRYRIEVKNRVLK